MDSGIETLPSSSRNASRKSSSSNNRFSGSFDDSMNSRQQRSRRRSSSSSATARPNNGIPICTSNGLNGSENQLSVNSSYKIPVLGFEVMEERAKFTVFKLRVENDQLNENWLVFRRYTDFERLYAKLKEEFPRLAISLPPKRWLRDNFETTFLEDRMKGLQAFVDSILIRHKLTESRSVREFFCFDDPPLHTENTEEANSFHFSDENKLASALTAQQNEIDVLKTELLLVKTQYENLMRLTKNCSHCNIEQRRSSLTIMSPTTQNKSTSNTQTESPLAESTPTKAKTTDNSNDISNNDHRLPNSKPSPTKSSSSSSPSTSYSEIVPNLKKSLPKTNSSRSKAECALSAGIATATHPLAPTRSKKSKDSSTASLESRNISSPKAKVGEPEGLADTGS